MKKICRREKSIPKAARRELKFLPKKTASCGDLMRAAKAESRWVAKDFRPGGVVIYDFPGGAATGHTGMSSA